MQLQFPECKLFVSCVPSWLCSSLAVVGNETPSVLGKEIPNASNMRKTPSYVACFAGFLRMLLVLVFVLAKDA